MTAGDTVIAAPRTLTATFESADPSAVDELGGKGAGLARMTQSGLRVPPGFVVSTGACRQYLTGGEMPAGLPEEILAQLADLERRSGKTFGHGRVPLLVSVRSGAPVSMPGMMDTILNLGLGRDAAIAMAEAAADSRFMADLTARFHAMYSEIVLGALDVGDDAAEVVRRVQRDEPAGEVYDRVWEVCERALDAEMGESVPSDPIAQLMGAIQAVFKSWNTRRAKTYREFHAIPHDMGTAVVVQSMVFGNIGADSGSGVVFTRNPVTGEPGLFGEYLANSQGEDVVAGTRTPDPVVTALAPPLLEELSVTCRSLEAEQGDVLDIEFTVERDILYFLQVRSAKRTPEAAVRIAADLVAEAALTPPEALRLISPEQVRQIQRPGFDSKEVDEARARGQVLARGVAACPGQVSGILVVDPDRAKEAADDGKSVILARAITSPADLHGMIAADGLVTATGGATSHAAVVARALGTACVVGVSSLEIDVSQRTVTIADRILREGDVVSLDGETGEFFAGAFTTSTPPEASAALTRLLTGTAATDCVVLARVATPAQVEQSRTAGASGIVCDVEELLTAGGGLAGLLDTAMSTTESQTEVLTDLVAEAVTPLLKALGTGEVVVRSLDLLCAAGRLDRAGSLLARRPELAFPLGAPWAIDAQLAGLDRAAWESGTRIRAHLSVPRVSDAAEAVALTTRDVAYECSTGAGLTTVRGLNHAAAVADHHAGVWADVAGLHAAILGVPEAVLMSPEPMDDYVKRGLLSSDPRHSVDPAVLSMLESLASRSDPGQEAVGVHLSGRTTAPMVSDLHRAGVRRFGVDAAEVRPLLLMLAHANAENSA